MTIKPNVIPKKKLAQIWAQVPADYYDQGIAKNPFQRLWHMRKLAQIVKLLPKEKSRPNAKFGVLDIGCSSGVLTSQIAQALPKAKITGIDSYKKAIKFAQSKYPNLTFLVADAHKLPFNDKSLDLVICTETLEHLVDPQKALIEIKRVLKKDGFAIISMDSGNLLFRVIWYFWTKTKGKVWDSAHLHEFNAKLLEDLIVKSGFKIKRRINSHLNMAITFLAIPRKP